MEEAFEGEFFVGFEFEFAAGVLFLIGGEVGLEQAFGDGEGVQRDVSEGVHGDDGAGLADGVRRDLAHGGDLDVHDVARLAGLGGDDEIDEQDEEDIDHGNDRDLGSLAGDAVEAHGEGSVFDGRALADVGEVGEQGFEPGGEDLDAAGEVAVGDDAGDGDGEAEDGGVEGDGNALGDGGGVVVRSEALEDGDEAGGGAEQA